MAPKAPRKDKLSPGRGRPKKKRLGTSRKGNYRHRYRQEDLLRAISAVVEDKMSFRSAAKEFGVPNTTLRDRIQMRVSANLGRPAVLTMEEENTMAERLVLMSEWGFPLTKLDLQLLVKGYLDALGRETRWPENKPGRGFVKRFFRRHPELTVRRANLIKRSRAAVSHDDINSFFDHFEVTAVDVPREAMTLYTNLKK